VQGNWKWLAGAAQFQGMGRPHLLSKKSNRKREAGWRIKPRKTAYGSINESRSMANSQIPRFQIWTGVFVGANIRRRVVWHRNRISDSNLALLRKPKKIKGFGASHFKNAKFLI
jgi:hypothetical protein